MKAYTITFLPDGTGKGIASDIIPMNEIGEVTKVRASHVEPVSRLKRVAFHCLREAFGESGRVAKWTREWVGPWQVRWAGDATPSFQHDLRAVCIEWEVNELNRRINESLTH